MGKIAFVFSGQGAQHPGMGRGFYDGCAPVRRLFDEAERFRPGTLEMMFAGDEAELRRTENTQPCLYLADLGAALAMKEAGVLPAAAAGFSLGEIPALAFAGAYSYLDGFSMAVCRGAFMGKAAEAVSASMAAILKLPYETVEELCTHYRQVYPVNYNGGGQLVVSGASAELEPFCREVKAAGGRAILLAVGGGFHSPFMDEAAKSFGEALGAYTLEKPALLTYANYTGAPYTSEVRALLENQINHPVRWETIIRAMLADGFDTFVETGVGETLKKLIAKISPESKCFAVNSPETLAAACEEIRHA